MSHDALQLAGDLRATLSGVRFPVTRSAAIELRKCVSEYAAAMKSAGVPPEDAVVAVKDVLQEAGFEPTTHSESTKAALTPQDRLRGHVILWCIEGYYPRDQSPVHDSHVQAVAGSRSAQSSSRTTGR
ncbi:MAG TPA: hypothetical protein VGQ56_07840 [Gemmatimonadaceae bacterium]|jgi:hypothetical protein|nr:hypothetical protein [Gemmatimonadaceae bacterium]